MTEEQREFIREIAKEMKFYYLHLSEGGLPEKLVSDLVRDWHAVRISAALSGEERDDV